MTARGGRSLSPEAALTAARGLALRNARASLKKLAPGPVRAARDDLLLFVSVRNEAARLPFFLEHYRRLGVDRFFVVDNGSTDGGPALLRGLRDTHVFRTEQRFSEAGMGRLWAQVLLDDHGRGHWCLVVDADELLVYPRWERLPLKGLCRLLEREGADGMRAILLDMYADGFPPLEESRGRPLWETFPFFDRDPRSYRLIPHEGLPGRRARFGGVRRRIFGVNSCLEKVPLVRYGRRMRLDAVGHWVENVRFSAVEGALLHFKFDAGFERRAREEALREEHFDRASEYKRYARVLADGPRSLKGPASERLENFDRLVELGFMAAPSALDREIPCP